MVSDWRAAHRQKQTRSSQRREETPDQNRVLSEIFEARVRYSGASLGAQLASVLAGGLSPFIATALLPYGGKAVAVYVVVMALITIVAVLAATETRYRQIAE
jgi:MHS family shikimate/dehydroshikimate transporter-like MFS transporter